jgi:hypothetical protein
VADFLHIYFKPKADAKEETYRKTFDLALDWYRYASNVYVVYTSSDPEKWYARLVDYVKPEGSLFICKLDVSARQGWMTKEFWTWLKEDREERKNNTG